MNHDKYQIRATMSKLNREVSPVVRTESAIKLFQSIEQLPIYGESHSIALFLSLPDEIPTLEVVERWYSQGKRILVPRVVGDDMEFVEYRPSELRSGSFGIMEPTSTTVALPSEIDLMILPGVAFCRDGRRLGRGRGYYDRYLSHEGFRGYTIGVGYAHQLTYDIPCEPHDKVLNLVLTPRVESPIPQLVINIINSAWGAAESIGCSVESLNERGLSWVLLRFRVELERTPEADEKLMIDTYISDWNRITTHRNFIIKDSQGVQIGVAISQWCIIDLESRRAVDLTRYANNYAQHIDSRGALLQLSRKIPTLPDEECDASYTHLAVEHDIDFNRHVNTIRYIEMMIAMLPYAQISSRGRMVADLQFAHETRLGELLKIKKKGLINNIDTEATSPYQSLFEITAPDGTSAVRAIFEL